MDMFGSCDPYVIAELLPTSFYQKNHKTERTAVQQRTQDPEYNKLVHW